MDLLHRVARILKAAWHDLAEKTKDPELELGRYVESCELALAELEAEIETAARRRQELEREAAAQRAAAEAAGRAGDRSAARAALLARREALAEARLAEENAAADAALLALLESDAAALAERLRDVRREQKRLAVRLRGAEAGARVAAVIGRPDPFERHRETITERVHAGEAAAEAGRALRDGTLEARLRALEEPGSIEAELEALMQRTRAER